MSDLGKIFGERVKELREDKGISIRMLAKEINIAHSAIARWENGTKLPSVESVVIVADYFGVTTDYLLGLEDY